MSDKEFLDLEVQVKNLIKLSKQLKESNIHLLKKNKELPILIKKDAREILERRLAELAQLHNFQYNRVSIRNQRTRWGSCSSKDNISLNMKLLHYPIN